MLRDVVVCSGLSEGISDGILKQVSENIHSYSFDNQKTGTFLTQIVIGIFFQVRKCFIAQRCKSEARLSIFPQTDDLKELRPVIETTLVRLGYSLRYSVFVIRMNRPKMK